VFDDFKEIFRTNRFKSWNELDSADIGLLVFIIVLVLLLGVQVFLQYVLKFVK
jgi:hypothetical protein